MRGGAGRGQGRKPLGPGQKKLPVSVRLPPAVIDWMDAQPGRSRAELIEAGLRNLIGGSDDQL